MDELGMEISGAGQGVELGASRAQSEAMATVQSQVLMAKRFPRDEAEAYGRITKACERFNFAAGASYSYRRGGQPITGGSIDLAREMKRCWGNIVSGSLQQHETDDFVMGRAWAWDVELNTFGFREFRVSKSIWKAPKGSAPGRWIKYDGQSEDGDIERSWREKFQNVAARAEREVIFDLLPPDFVEDALEVCRETIEKGMATDPDKALKLVIRGMLKLNITAAMIEEYLGCPLAQASPKQIEDLRNAYAKINSAETTWVDYTKEPIKQPRRKSKKSAVKSDSPPETEPEDGPEPENKLGASLTIEDFPLKLRKPLRVYGGQQAAEQGITFETWLASVPDTEDNRRDLVAASTS